jgi:putative hydrolase of the HAD superfamily
MTVTTLLVDFGEVISHPQSPVAVAEMARLVGVDTEAFTDNYWLYRGDYDAGCTAMTYWSNVLGRPISDTGPELAALIDLDIASWTRLNFLTLSVLRQAANSFRLVLLSNAPHEQARAVRQFRVMRTFTDQYFSAELGMIKPDPRIFTTVLDLIGARPDETAFIDNWADNLITAERLGMRAIKFDAPEQIGRVLRQLTETSPGRGRVGRMSFRHRRRQNR